MTSPKSGRDVTKLCKLLAIDPSLGVTSALPTTFFTVWFVAIDCEGPLATTFRFFVKAQRSLLCLVLSNVQPSRVAVADSFIQLTEEGTLQPANTTTTVRSTLQPHIHDAPPLSRLLARFCRVRWGM